MKPKPKKQNHNSISKQSTGSISRVNGGEVRVQRIEGSYAGLVPHPSHLEEFERILPGSAARFFSWVETEQTERLGMMKFAVQSDAVSMQRGQLFVLLVALASILGTVLCAYWGQTWPAVALSGAGLASFALAFLWGKAKRDNDIADGQGKGKPDSGLGVGGSD